MCSQAVDADYMCPVCQDLLYEPVSTPCGHRYCKHCFYPALKATGSDNKTAAASGHKFCPMCREPIPLSCCDPPIEASLWERLQAEYPERVKRRGRAFEKMRAAAAAAGGGSELLMAPAAADGAGSGPSYELTRDRMREEMRVHRAALEAADSSYFQKLEDELSRPQGELRRCRCPARYVCIRKVQRTSGSNLGRAYYGCPLWKPGGDRQCRFYEYEY